jgi:hypothetical protein
MIVLEFVGGLVVIGVIAAGVWFLINNITLNTQKGRKK